MSVILVIQIRDSELSLNSSLDSTYRPKRCLIFEFEKNIHLKQDKQHYIFIYNKQNEQKTLNLAPS